MKLRQVMDGVVAREILCSGDEEVTGLAVDSRAVRPGELFFGLRGRKVDGQSFAGAAIARGALAAVVPHGATFEGPRIEVDDVAEAMAIAAANFWGVPARRLRLIGITGTNGKTTTAHMTRRILQQAGFSCGMLGTVNHVVGGRVIPSDNTTPMAGELHRLLAEMVEAGDTHVVMEVSSHGLALKRVFGIRFTAGIFTNLTHEHLDFHGDIEAYLSSKAILMAQSDISVLNLDDPAFERLKSKAGLVVTYSLEQKADFTATDVEHDGRHSRFILNAGERTVPISMGFPGRYNVSNALAAAGAAVSLGVPLEHVAAGLRAAESVPGRMEYIDLGQRFRAIVDYAHTPDGLVKALTTVREVTPGRLISVFGGRGERDRMKRPVMGRIAASLADEVIITTDCPYGEDPEIIAREVAQGADEGRAGHRIVLDRVEAIREACRMAGPGDTVIITGRGHEPVQHFRGGDLYLDDREALRIALRDILDTSPELT